MTSYKIKLSVLDQSPIRKGETARQALQETTELATLSDELGYTRFWVAEHHNSIALACSAPEILIAHLANHTRRIRVGSGGIMLPNHSTLKMAENFRMLESLHPHRIDMGIGRAPGTDRITASLLNPSNTFNPQEYLNQLRDLDKYLNSAYDRGTIFEKVKAIPMATSIPQQWLLTSSGDNAMLAANLGKATSYAHFINPVGGPDALAIYRNRFKESDELSAPMASVSIFVYCSEDKKKLDRQKALMDYRFLQLEKGGNPMAVSYEEIENVNYSEQDCQRIAWNSQRYIIGTPDEVKPRIEALSQDYGVSEVMIVTYTESKEDKQDSYRLLAEMFLND